MANPITSTINSAEAGLETEVEKAEAAGAADLKNLASAIIDKAAGYKLVATVTFTIHLEPK